MAPFIKKLLDAISEVTSKSGNIESPLYRMQISLEWIGDKRYPYIHISIPTDDIQRITKVIILLGYCVVFT